MYHFSFSERQVSIFLHMVNITLVIANKSTGQEIHVLVQHSLVKQSETGSVPWF